MYVENVTIANNCAYGILSDSGIMSIRNAAIHDVGTGVSGGIGTTLEVKDSFITNVSGVGIEALSGILTVDNCTVTHSSLALGVASGTIVLSNSTITQNTKGLQAGAGGTIISFVNNRIINNGVDGAPTKSVFQK